MKWLKEKKIKKIEKHVDRMPALTRQSEKIELNIKIKQPGEP